MIKELPHDLLAEKSFLSCLLVDGQAIDEVVELGIKREDFHHPKHGKVFSAILELSHENNPIDLVTVCSKLQDQGELESLGGQSFILELMEDQASSTNISHYGKSVKEKASVREIARTAKHVWEAATQFSGNTEEFLSEVEEKFFKLTTDAKSNQMQKLSSCLTANLKEMYDPSKKAGEINGIPTGFVDLDRKLLGMRAGQLIIVAARPGMGKTALALNMATNAIKATKLPVAVFSLEMLAPELSLRILSSESKISTNRLRAQSFSQTDIKKMNKVVSDLSSHPLFINDSANLSIFDIQGQCRKIKAQQGLGLIIVDYIQLMRPHNGKIPREQQISEISRGLKQMAKEMECPVLALSQLNRSSEARTDKRPMASDLRESGSLEQDSDIVLLIYRDDYYNPDTKEQGIAELSIAKNRSGEQGIVKVSWKGDIYLFDNLEQFREVPPEMQ
ncbi:MAG: replicative DNA helicase [Bacteriovoracales bacterium]|nr:replicative DNA helicase [Bacteriovoracales bacterium]